MDEQNRSELKSITRTENSDEPSPLYLRELDELGGFLLAVWELKKEKLEAEEIFKAVTVKTQRDVTLADIARQRAVMWFLFSVGGFFCLLILLYGLKLITLPVSFLIAIGGLGGIGGITRLLVKKWGAKRE
jgi:hypothetical protein